MDIFDDEIINELSTQPIQESKCVTQNDAMVMFMCVYLLDIFIRMVGKQDRYTFRNLKYYIEKFIINNLKNGSEHYLEEDPN